MKYIAGVLFAVLPQLSQAKLLFEGFYRVESGSNHIGYVVQRDEINEKTKERTITYFGIRSQKGIETYDGTKVTAREVPGMPFEPVRYTHMVSGSGKGPPLIEEGIFSGKNLNINVSDGSVQVRVDKKKKEIEPAAKARCQIQTRC